MWGNCTIVGGFDNGGNSGPRSSVSGVWVVYTVIPGVDLVSDTGRVSVVCVSTFSDADVVWVVCVRS